MNTYEGYFEHLIKELMHLMTTGKLTPEAVRKLLLKTNNSKETFLHILACRHGVGHRVITSVLKNIEPEVMDVILAIFSYFSYFLVERNNRFSWSQSNKP